MEYRFNEESYTAVGASGVGWLSVVDVLNAHPQVRQPIGAVLRIAATDRHGRWLVVALIEEPTEDDVYTVVSARLLDAEEIEAVTRILREGRHHDDS